MPSSILATDALPASALTPPARTIDPRGQRFGAGASVAILGAAAALNAPWLTALVGANLLVAAATGARNFLPGRPWPAIRRALRLGPAEPEHEYPPRFAQAMGGTVLALAALAFLAGAPVLGWVLVAAVATLQTILAATGICIGCRLYFLRWYVPGLFARVFGRADRLTGVVVPGGRLDYPRLDYSRSPR
jgi:hypothetical protein